MNVLLIRPPVIHKKGDFFGSIPGIPTGIAHLASVVRHYGHTVRILDCYGESPHRFYRLDSEYEARGMTPLQTAQAASSGWADIVGLSIHCTTEQVIARYLISEIRKRCGDIPLVVGGYHATFLPEAFIEMGADYVVLGAGEKRLPGLLHSLSSHSEISPDGIATTSEMFPRTTFLDGLDGYPLPAVELLPLENYWKLGYGHGPVRGKYMNMLTSRGCPFKCGFCQAPLMSGGKWLARSPHDVMRELRYYHEQLGISDFHIQDENFALNRKRTLDLCNAIISYGADLTFCLPSGVNAMTLSPEIVDVMARAGFRYLSVSPESGSPRVLDLMRKRMDLDTVTEAVGMCRRNGIRTNACFMLGYPGETADDRRMTMRYVRRLARAGVDEIIVPIMTPFPHTPSMNSFQERRPEELCFSPTWRSDYKALSRFRFRLYVSFLLQRIRSFPLSILRQIRNVSTGNHETKGEMTVTRIVRDTKDRIWSSIRNHPY